MADGGNIDNLYIQVKSSANSASKALDKLAASLENISDITANTGLSKLAKQLNGINLNARITTATANTNKLNGTMGSLWKTLKKIAVVSGAISLFKKGYGLATDFFETANYFRVVMGEYTEDAYKYAQSVSEALGLNESDWMQNQATFMSLASTFGNTADNAYLMSKNLTQLVYDLSSLKNVNADVAMQKLRSAFAGEIEPLRDWGVDLSKANLQLVALEHNITKTFDKMTQAEKSQLRYVTIMNQLEYAMGDLSNTLNSPGNQLRLLEIAVQKAARAFGNIFIPILNKIIPVVIAVANAIRFLFEQIAALFGFEYPEMTNWDKYGDGIGNVADNLDDATKKAKKFKGQLAGFDEINNLTTNNGGSGNDSGGYFGGLELPTYESLGKSFLGDALEQKIASIQAKLMPLIELIKQLAPYVAAIGAAFLTWKAGILILETIPNLINNFKVNFGTLVAAISAHPILFAIVALVAALALLYMKCEGFREWVNNTVSQIVSWVQRSMPLIGNIITAGLTMISAFLMLFYKGVIAAGQGLVKTIILLVRTLATTVLAIAGGIWVGVKAGFNGVVGAFKGLLKSFQDIWGSIKKVFQGMVSFVTGIFTGDMSKAFKGLIDVVGGIWQGFIAIVKTPFNIAVSAINGIIDSINSVKFTVPIWVPIIGGKKWDGLNIPKLKYFAEGGVVNRPTNALIGEDGPEAVVPLERNTEWINNLANKINDRADNTDTTAVLNNIYQYLQTMNLQPRITVDDVGKANDKYLDRKLRIQGV